MIERIFYTVVIALALLVGGGLLLPREVHVERSIEIQRPVNTVFTVINRFEAFPAWSPWSGRDPGVEYVFSGPVAGTGARMEWSGDPRQVGKGWMEITESRPNSLVRAHLVLEQQGEAESTFTVERIAGGARITWSFDTDLVAGQGHFGGLMARYFGLFFDRWIGGDFENGLSDLKAYIESLPAADFSGLDVELLEVQAADVLSISVQGRPDSDAVAVRLASAYREISGFMAANGIELTAQPIAISRIRGNGAFSFEAAIPVQRIDIDTTGRVRWGTSPAGRSARLVHRGSYDDMPRSYEKLAAWMAAHGYRQGGVSWEQYISDPGQVPIDERITHIYFLLDESP
ncbi:MAG: SRPBCC family protein [Xanthomonadales bacterium]|jgi:effector-binding domain-containing protein|nr:SRPBCC family protein [Xanthomonadales bacterium]